MKWRVLWTPATEWAGAAATFQTNNRDIDYPEAIRGFPQSFQVNATRVPLVGKGPFLRNHFQNSSFVLPPDHSTIYRPEVVTESIVKTPTEKMNSKPRSHINVTCHTSHESSVYFLARSQQPTVSHRKCASHGSLSEGHAHTYTKPFKRSGHYMLHTCFNT
jgi:hypothetical protein